MIEIDGHIRCWFGKDQIHVFMLLWENAKSFLTIAEKGIQRLVDLCTDIFAKFIVNVAFFVQKISAKLKNKISFLG